MQITSRDNRLIKEGRRLLADARARRETGRFVIEGARLCEDAALSGVPIETVLCTPRAAEAYGRQMAALDACGAPRVEITEEIARHLADTASPQGIFCVCRTLDKRGGLDTIKRMGKYLALEDMQDPANLGAIIRTAEAFGLDGLLLSAGCCDMYNPKVLRASMGGVFRLPCVAVPDMAPAVKELQAVGMTCLACVPDAAATPLPRAALGPGTVCLIGNEGNGLRPGTMEACAGRVTIPMAGRAESLNASMAAGIVLWEMMRAT